MKNLELNKMLGAFLFVLFVVAFSSNFIDIVYSSLNGVSVHGNNEESVSHENSETPATEQVEIAAQEKNFDIPALLKVASTENGKKLTAKCTSCHSFDKGGANKVGPNLYGILGAKIGHRDDYKYSSALLAHGGKWDYKSIFQWIHAPKKFIPGNKMAYGGVSKEQDVADLVAYLRTMNDSPPAYE